MPSDYTWLTLNPFGDLQPGRATLKSLAVTEQDKAPASTHSLSFNAFPLSHNRPRFSPLSKSSAASAVAVSPAISHHKNATISSPSLLLLLTPLSTRFMNRLPPILTASLWLSDPPILCCRHPLDLRLCTTVLMMTKEDHPAYTAVTVYTTL